MVCEHLIPLLVRMGVRTVLHLSMYAPMRAMHTCLCTHSACFSPIACADFCSPLAWRMQARSLLAQLRKERKIFLAQQVISKYFHGWQVRKLYKPKFRRIAGPKVSHFMITALVSIQPKVAFFS